MDGKIVSFENDEIDDAVNIAIKNRLYSPNGSMYDTCFRNYKIKVAITLAKILIYYLEDKPVGILVNSFGKTSTIPSIMIYVKYKHRRKGIGTAMIKEYLKNADRCMYSFIGSNVQASTKFWESIKNKDIADMDRVIIKKKSNQNQPKENVEKSVDTEDLLCDSVC